MDDQSKTDLTLSCDRCGIQACATDPATAEYPQACPVVDAPELLAAARGVYAADTATGDLARAAARTESGGYCQDPRVVEIMHFARRLGTNHLGIACCIGLQREAKLAADIFRANGFTVSCVICKVGGIPKEELGLVDAEKIRPGQFEAVCNPVAQARLLDSAGCGLNVVIGLCVGHDSVFFQHSRTPVTVLVAKDRVTGHNPAAALYTSHSYYRRLKDGQAATGE